MPSPPFWLLQTGLAAGHHRRLLVADEGSRERSSVRRYRGRRRMRLVASETSLAHVCSPPGTACGQSLLGNSTGVISSGDCNGPARSTVVLHGTSWRSFLLRLAVRG